jgi:DNA-binding response OmpR family regulator
MNELPALRKIMPQQNMVHMEKAWNRIPSKSRSTKKQQTILLENQPVRLISQPWKSWDEDTAKENMIIATGDLLIDLYARIVYKEGVMVRLGPIEFDILAYLLCHYTMFCPRRILLSLVEQRYNHKVADNTLSKHINRLRKKLDQNVFHQYVLTRNSSGYKWGLPMERLYLVREDTWAG